MVDIKFLSSILLLVLGLGALGGGFYANIYIGDQLEQGIRDNLVIDGPSDPDYQDWLTSEDAGDAPLFKSYYFWNLTNPDEYMAGSKPQFEELGPYVYRQYDRKLNVTFENGEVTYRTFTYYIFMSNMSSGDVGDKIVNINPQYLGVIESAGSEYNLMVSFVGPTITQVVDGLTTDFANGVQVQGAVTALNETYNGLTTDFAAQVLVQGTATVLQEVKAGVIEQLHHVVNASTAANLIDASYSALEGSTNSTYALEQFFNSTTFSTDTGSFIQGVSEFAGTGLGFTATAADRLLNTGVAALNLTGWISDLDQGLGVLGFLQAYQKAANTSDTSLDLATLGALYDATDQQLGAAAIYLQNHLIADKVQTFYVGTFGKTTREGAEDLFYDQWASGDKLPNPIDLDGDGNADGVEAGVPVDTDISTDEAKAIFNESIALAITNETGIFAWFEAMQGNATLDALIGATFGINATQRGMVYSWLNSFKNGFAQTSILDELGLPYIELAGIVQWGDSSITEGRSIFDIDPTAAPNYPEFWAWSKHIAGTGMTFNFTMSQALLNGTDHLRNATRMGQFLALVADGNFSTIKDVWGLNTTEAGALVGYIQYLISDFVMPTFASLGISSLEDIGYAQWGSNAFGAGSTFVLDPTLGFYPELWAYASEVAGSPYSFNLTKAKAVLTGQYAFTDSTNVGMFLQLAAAGDLATINALWGLNATDANVLAGYINYLIDNPINAVISPVLAAGGGLVTTRTVDQWLWNHQDPLLLFLQANGIDVDPSANLFTNHTDVNEALDEKTSTIKTGANNLEEIAQYVKWQENTTVTVWQSDEPVRGTGGTQFAPGVTTSETLVVWVSELLRAVDFVFAKETQVEGIDLLRFELSDDTLKSSSQLAANAKYYQGIAGLANMTAAQGIPLFLSKPHFLDADSSLGTGMGISTADPEKHDTFLDVEPITGAVMNAKKRLQINLQVQASDYFSKDIMDEILPLVWVEEGGSIQPDQAQAFKDAVYGAQDLQRTLTLGGPTLGIVFIATAVVLIGRRKL